MPTKRIAELERKLGALVVQAAAQEYAISALVLAMRDMDATSVEGVHAFLMNASLAERQRGGASSEARATTVDVLADRLRALSREFPPLTDRNFH